MLTTLRVSCRRPLVPVLVYREGNVRVATPLCGFSASAPLGSEVLSAKKVLNSRRQVASRSDILPLIACCGYQIYLVFSLLAMPLIGSAFALGL